MQKSDNNLRAYNNNYYINEANNTCTYIKAYNNYNYIIMHIYLIDKSSM